MAETPELMTSKEVADLFRTTRQTVSRWKLEGRITPVRTPGKALRFRRSEIYALLEPAA